MSEGKLYAVKNDEGKYLTIERRAPWWDSQVGTAVRSSAVALAWTEKHGGHVVTFVEEPEKVVLTKEQAEIVEKARVSDISATYISARTDEYNGEESLLMEAFVNGYAVANEKKYNVKVPYAEGWHFQKYSSASKLGPRNDWKPFPAKDIDSNMSKELFQFTETEIEHYGLQDCEKEEVTDDGK